MLSGTRTTLHYASTLGTVKSKQSCSRGAYCITGDFCISHSMWLPLRYPYPQWKVKWSLTVYRLSKLMIEDQKTMPEPCPAHSCYGFGFGPVSEAMNPAPFTWYHSVFSVNLFTRQSVLITQAIHLEPIQIKSKPQLSSKQSRLCCKMCILVSS